ncbi:LacI family DNA-binding transcriptional regulator [Curtobacterium sp. 9128]|uniref:LacI family DNA-binding transcriptional regulator n=1 Tax=Curtobacterium sp. 9128 TaxID=1793722 RepID=UPI0011A608CA|nr:LacI family DNA-binding transcriptional regulator [Curtobacterium sp. 9128]
MTLEGPEKPTIYDVALVAGVSHQTVSRVLNRPETVRPANRHRVLAVIAYLGYERNAEAERLGRLHKHPADSAE